MKLHASKSVRHSCSLVIFLFTCLSLDVVAQGIDVLPYSTRTTFEQITLPLDEKMGLLGVSVLGEQYRWAYYGAAAYGAVTGDRGGFFTGGLEAGVNSSREWPVQLEAGLFAGAGGGGAAPQGGGLMLRPHVGLMLAWPYGTVGVQYSSVDFPNGDISSEQLALQLDISSTALIGSGWLGRDDLFWSFRRVAKEFSLIDQPRSFKAIFKHYIPSDATTRSGSQAEPHDVLGLEWNRYGSGDGYLRIETAGALGGGSDGYAEVLAGAGYRFRLSERGQLRAAVGLGAAGGGNVDTGGGFVADGYLGYDYLFSNGVELGGRVGYMVAPDGDFQAASLGLNLGYRFDVPAISEELVSTAFDRSGYEPSYLRLRTVHHSYIGNGGNLRKRGNSDQSNVDLIGAKIDYMLSERLYLSGQGLFAYAGGAGGYAAGLFGVGLHQPLWRDSRLSIDAEFNAGAAGGGGLAVGSGAIVQPMVGVNYRVSQSLGIGLGMSRLMALSGDLDASVVELSVNYRFTTIARAVGG